MTIPIHSEKYQLYQRPKDTGPFYVSFSIKGHGQKKYALGTRDKQEAEQLAYDKWKEAETLANLGMSITQKSFETIAEEFIAVIESEVQRGDRAEYHERQYVPMIRRYFVGKFGQRKMTAIKTNDIEKYWEWRMEYWISGDGSKDAHIRYKRYSKGLNRTVRRPVKEGIPSISTLAKEAMVLKQLFQFGLRRAYTLEMPKIQAPKAKRRTVNEKPSFTLQEFIDLKEVSEKRVKEYEGDPRYDRTYRDRLKLHCYCMIAGFTGLRPTELTNLKWRDIGYRTIELDDKVPFSSPVIAVRGKAKTREMAAMPEVITFFHTMRELFPLDAGRIAVDTDPVFYNRQGQRVQGYKKGLASLLEAANLRHLSDGRKRDSGSFRSFYITQQIREGVGHHILGRNVGTSTKMIDNYYSKVRPTEEIKMLIPDWMKQRPIK